MDATPYLEVYYAAACAPCRQELPILVEAADQGVRLVVYVLDTPDGLPPAAADHMVLTSPAKPRDVLRQAGDAQGILPFARTLRPDGTMCGTWQGRLTLPRIRTLLNSCG